MDLDKQARILSKHAVKLLQITKENEVYIALGNVLILNQFFEGTLKKEIQLRYLSQEKELPKGFNDQTLGFFIKILKNSIPDTDKNKNIIEQLFVFNKMRIEIIHKFFEIDDDAPRTFELFIKKRIKDKDLMNEIKKMAHLSLKCLESVRCIG